MKWQASRPQAWAWRGWGDETVCYNVLSGDTYLLSEASAAVYNFLVQCPKCDADEVLTGVFGDAAAQVSKEERSYIVQILFQLNDLGLIQSSGS